MQPLFTRREAVRGVITLVATQAAQPLAIWVWNRYGTDPAYHDFGLLAIILFVFATGTVLAVLVMLESKKNSESPAGATAEPTAAAEKTDPGMVRAIAADGIREACLLRDLLSGAETVEAVEEAKLRILAWAKSMQRRLLAVDASQADSFGDSDPILAFHAPPRARAQMGIIAELDRRAVVLGGCGGDVRPYESTKKQSEARTIEKVAHETIRKLEEETRAREAAEEAETKRLKAALLKEIDRYRESKRPTTGLASLLYDPSKPPPFEDHEDILEHAYRTAREWELSGFPQGKTAGWNPAEQLGALREWLRT